MGRPKIDGVVEGIITYLLRKKTSYRHIQRELKGQGHDISIATIHRVKHLIGKSRGTCYKKAKIGPYKRTPQKSTPGVIRKVAIMIKRVNELLTQKLLKQGYRYHKLRKTFSKFYRRYYDLISKFQVGLKSLLRQGLSEPDFYGDLVYKLKKIVGSNNFSAQFIKIISHYKKIGYNINVLQQTACLVVNPITVGNFAFLFNCMPVGRTSDSMMVPT